jgi:hypothetical protein
VACRIPLAFRDPDTRSGIASVLTTALLTGSLYRNNGGQGVFSPWLFRYIEIPSRIGENADDSTPGVRIIEGMRYPARQFFGGPSSFLLLCSFDLPLAGHMVKVGLKIIRTRPMPSMIGILTKAGLPRRRYPD